VGVLPRKRDLEILLAERWYRIPVETKVSGEWPPKVLAFYEGAPIRDDRGIYRYADVQSVEECSREELFPGELTGSRRGKRYYRLRLGSIQVRAQPITFPRPRRFAFLRTSMKRFDEADTVNDLFADSPLEDTLWEAFKERDIPAERQWEARANGGRYFLDFALFCRGGKIDVEADGDTYHLNPEQGPRDNERNNELTSFGWSVLRFGTRKIRQHLSESCDKVLEMVQQLKGFDSPKLVPTRYVRTASGVVPQLSLFEDRAEYDAKK